VEKVKEAQMTLEEKMELIKTQQIDLNNLLEILENIGEFCKKVEP